MVNALFLSRFWHVLRVVPLPTYFLQKISSITYQFVTHRTSPRLKQSVLYHPMSTGGLSVIEIHAQQKVLQRRYVQALLLNNRQCSPIPNYLYELLTCYPQVNYGTNCHQIPLLFHSARQTSRARGLHAFSSIFKAIDSMPTEELGPTVLELPFSPSVSSQSPPLAHLTMTPSSRLKPMIFCSRALLEATFTKRAAMLPCALDWEDI
ncbi:hypothetical protein [Parasitella parasitica]|uniref:Uncharacterized protein n=1 Tax=Parasitella parasitica TaxID=35722 RepID=A0A0B7NHN7_9FUNG|nr:hypothetical protein [Parasitella parasitica]